ncbi:MgtC/SapB family protein [uncultured Tateyamaria sp.]|uniref:MgtC/SapB family protein n=1 Tax=uncultured Tateyamaria sp. TaxID=455651 RepID=UPI00262D9232|nr:MgtC/SapB family protein [uncultured Tateyamaria sp.]
MDEMAIGILTHTAALNLLAAMLCGAMIGSERQIRRRMAGLRTNALVAVGAAGFVVFAALFPDDMSPTRVAAQVVSGIGFLGAGIMFRHGFTIHGLNTAATLWCSAAVGLMCGTGAYLIALTMTGIIMFINIGLRPVVTWFSRLTKSGHDASVEFHVTLSCAPSDEGAVRNLAAEIPSTPGFRLLGLEREQEAERVLLEVIICAGTRGEEALRQSLMPLLRDPRVSNLHWERVGASRV